MIHLITDLFLCSHHSQKFLKGLYIIDYIIISILITYSLMNNLASGIHHQQTPTYTLTALNKLLVGGIFCDLQKAFDCANQDILLSKIESYLQDGYQRVLVDLNSRKYHSNWESVTEGVPQGSILSPLLFILYINDFPNVIFIHLFAFIDPFWYKPFRNGICQ